MWYESVPKTDPTKDVTAWPSIDSIKIIATNYTVIRNYSRSNENFVFKDFDIFTGPGRKYIPTRGLRTIGYLDSTHFTDRVVNALLPKALVSASVPQCLVTENSVPQCLVLALKKSTSASEIFLGALTSDFSAFSAGWDLNSSFLDSICENSP